MSYPTGDTFDEFRVASELGYATPTPKDPMGHAVAPDVCFGTGDVRISGTDAITTRWKNSDSSGGGGGGAVGGTP